MNKLARYRWVVFYLSISVLVAYLWWPTPLEKHLQLLLLQQANKVSITKPLTTLEARFRAKELSAILYEKVSVHYRSKDFEFERELTKKEIFDGMTGVLIPVFSSSVHLTQIKLQDSTKNTATVTFFLVAEWKESESGEPMQAAEQVQVGFVKREGEWVISGVETFVR